MELILSHMYLLIIQSHLFLPYQNLLAWVWINQLIFGSIHSLPSFFFYFCIKNVLYSSLLFLVFVENICVYLASFVLVGLYFLWLIVSFFFMWIFFSSTLAMTICRVYSCFWVLAKSFRQKSPSQLSLMSLSSDKLERHSTRLFVLTSSPCSFALLMIWLMRFWRDAPVIIDQLMS